MHKENFLFLNRVKPGVLGSHQKSKKDQNSSSTETENTPKKNIPNSPYSGKNTPSAASTLERGQKFWSNNYMNQI